MIWILNPLGYYGLLAVGLILCLYLFISVKQETAQLRQLFENQHRQSQDGLGEFRRIVGNLEHSLQEHEQDEALVAPMRVAPGVSINLTKRSQALRMYRRGETAEQICSTLQMPRNEVELLLKVHSALAEPSA